MEFDPNHPKNLALGGGYVGIARAEDLGDRLDRLGAVGQGRNSLRPADPVDFV